ncbi:MAG: class I SAM-dependent methyltransferase [Chitinophagaceae bacterium]
MPEDRFSMFFNRLTKVYRHLGKQARKKELSCYRIYDHDLPEFPLCIDRYGDRIYVAEYKRRHGLLEEAHEQWFKQSLKVVVEVLEVSPENIYTKLRQRKPGRAGQYRKAENEPGDFFEVIENGLNFWVNLTDYLDTGLFLDHRDTRQLVKSQSAGKRVLNLFAYTGSFSVYAASGAAQLVTTVDLSRTYLDWAQRNMALNGFTGNAYSFVQADVKEYLKQVPASSFDLIVMDPPTFSNSKRMEEVLDIQRDHVALLKDAIRVLSPQGVLYFSTNYTKFEMDYAALADVHIQDITKATTPFDFMNRLRRYCFRITK